MQEVIWKMKKVEENSVTRKENACRYKNNVIN